MSIIIEDMTMPECCMKCPMAAGYGCGYMGVAMATKDMKSGRHEDCPLEEAEDAEPLVHDGFYLCDKKPGACPSWTKYGWEKCMSPHCERTSRVDHALKLPDADTGWISVEDRLPEENGEYLVTRESAFYRYIDIVRKSNCNSDLPMASDIIAWMPLPKPYESKEDK